MENSIDEIINNAELALQELLDNNDFEKLKKIFVLGYVTLLEEIAESND